jgi:hypothetical protein
MIAPLQQPVHSSSAPLRVAMMEGRVRAHGSDPAGAAVAIGLAAFFCLLPYPAYAVGQATAVQIGNVGAALACLPALWVPWRRIFFMYPLLIAPLLISIMAHVFTGGDQGNLAMKTSIVWCMSLLPLLMIQLHAPRYGVAILVGMAAATLVHAIVGLWQVYAFSQNYFPLVEIYRNPSFLSVQDNADMFARWMKRPFGIFPEPSAMSASLGPWVLIWSALVCGVVRLKQPLARWQQLLFAAAAVGGISLIILSRSGLTVVLVPVLLLIAGLWLLRARASQGAFLAMIAALAIILPMLLWFAANAIGNRIGGGPIGNSSWEERASSLVLGFSIFTDGGIGTLVFGMGPGLASLAVRDASGMEAVWSVLLNYLYDTGLVGMLAAGCVALHLLRMWQESRYEPVFVGVLFVWLVAVLLTTSYDQLLSLWLILGWLTVWPNVMEPSRATSRAVEGRLR